MKKITLLLIIPLILAGCAPATYTPPPGPTTGVTLPPPTQADPPTTAPTSVPGTPGATKIQHVFVVVMENHGYSQVWNTSSSPYITSLGNTYAYATNYHAIQPSQPAQLPGLYGGDNFGITTDCYPVGLLPCQRHQPGR